MYTFGVFAALAASALYPFAHAVSSQTYTWKNVKIGGGGGFVPNIIFNPSSKGLAYARTDIGGAYKLNADDTWTPLLDFADNARWDYWGTGRQSHTEQHRRVLNTLWRLDALATDPVNPTRVYVVCLTYYCRVFTGL